MFPGETPEGIPVGLRKRMPAPVYIVADVGNSGNSSQRMRKQRAIRHTGDGRTCALHVSVTIQTFLPHGSEKGKVVGEAQILLCDLEFRHHGRFLHGSE